VLVTVDRGTPHQPSTHQPHSTCAGKHWTKWFNPIQSLESDRNSVSVSAPKLTWLAVSAWFRLRLKKN